MRRDTRTRLRRPLALGLCSLPTAAGKSTEQIQGSACGSITKLAASDEVSRLDEKWEYTRF